MIRQVSGVAQALRAAGVGKGDAVGVFMPMLPETVVAKVGDKIFAFLGSGGSVGVKCGASRAEADEWLLQYPDEAGAVAPTLLAAATSGDTVAQRSGLGDPR